METIHHISKAEVNDIPKDAILLSKDEVINMYWTAVKAWKPKSDVWPFSYGIALLSSTSASTSFIIVQHYRNKLKLSHFGRVSMVLPTIVIPTIISTATHLELVTNSMFLNEACPLCLETRAAALQVMGSIVFPTIVTPFAGFMYALRYGTYDVPPVRKENLKEIGQLWLKLVRGLRRRIVIPLVINAFLASAITYFEGKSLYTFQQKIEERENEYRKLVEEVT